MINVIQTEGRGPGGSAGEDALVPEGAAGSSGCGQETGGCNKRSGGDSEGGCSTGSKEAQSERLDGRGGLFGPLPATLRVCIRLS